MALSASAAALIASALGYALQGGFALSVGAETVLLAVLLVAHRDRAVDIHEMPFVRAARGVVWAGALLVLASSMAIAGLAAGIEHQSAAFSGAALFADALIAGALLLTASIHGSALAGELAEGATAATWYAAFAARLFAPAASWPVLCGAYGAWLVCFLLIWTYLVFALRGRSGGAVTTGLTRRALASSGAIPPAPPPPAAAHLAGDLAAMRVMPRTKDDLARPQRAPGIRFG